MQVTGAPVFLGVGTVSQEGLVSGESDGRPMMAPERLLPMSAQGSCPRVDISLLKSLGAPAMSHNNWLPRTNISLGLSCCFYESGLVMIASEGRFEN